jgi:hypothetical protein
MTGESLAGGVLIGVVQVTVALGCAPLLQGITKQFKARLQYRRGPSIWQPYRDLRKWWGKIAFEIDTASPLTEAAPVIVVRPWSPPWCPPDRRPRPPLLELATSSSSSACSPSRLCSRGRTRRRQRIRGMGASREVAIATLVEPGILLSLAVVVAAAGTTDLATIAGNGAAAGSALLAPPLLLAAAAFGIVAIAETGHEPVDNPDTHLELTMIHEGMLLGHPAGDWRSQLQRNSSWSSWRDCSSPSSCPLAPPATRRSERSPWALGWRSSSWSWRRSPWAPSTPGWPSSGSWRYQACSASRRSWH